jgi:hypothetical protein
MTLEMYNRVARVWHNWPKLLKSISESYIRPHAISCPYVTLSSCTFISSPDLTRSYKSLARSPT